MPSQATGPVIPAPVVFSAAVMEQGQSVVSVDAPVSADGQERADDTILRIGTARKPPFQIFPGTGYEPQIGVLRDQGQ